jgi:protein SCO1
MFENKRFKAVFCALLLGASLVFTTETAFSVERPEEVLDTEVGIFTELGVQVDLSLPFVDSNGVSHVLGDFLQPGAPLIIAPVYYKCPRLCGLLLDGLYTLLNEIPLKLGDDYNVLIVGFDPTETVENALEVRTKLNTRLKGEAKQRQAALNYVIGDQTSVTGLMKQLGFKYIKDGDDFAHSAAVMILTPQGKISQYFTGIQFSPWDARLALVEASEGKIGTAIDHLLLYCFRFDPLQGKYTWAVVALLRIGGVLTLLGLGLVYFFFGRRGDRRKERV